MKRLVFVLAFLALPLGAAADAPLSLLGPEIPVNTTTQGRRPPPGGEHSRGDLGGGLAGAGSRGTGTLRVFRTAPTPREPAGRGAPDQLRRRPPPAPGRRVSGRRFRGGLDYLASPGSTDRTACQKGMRSWSVPGPGGRRRRGGQRRRRGDGRLDDGSASPSQVLARRFNAQGQAFAEPFVLRSGPELQRQRGGAPDMTVLLAAWLGVGRPSPATRSGRGASTPSRVPGEGRFRLTSPDNFARHSLFFPGLPARTGAFCWSGRKPPRPLPGHLGAPGPELPGRTARRRGDSVQSRPGVHQSRPPSPWTATATRWWSPTTMVSGTFSNPRISRPPSSTVHGTH